MEPNGVFRGLTKVGLFTIYFTLKQEVFNFEKRYKKSPFPFHKVHCRLENLLAKLP